MRSVFVWATLQNWTSALIGLHRRRWNGPPAIHEQGPAGYVLLTGSRHSPVKNRRTSGRHAGRRTITLVGIAGLRHVTSLESSTKGHARGIYEYRNETAQPRDAQVPADIPRLMHTANVS